MKIIHYDLTAFYYDDEYPEYYESKYIDLDYEWVKSNISSLIITLKHAEDITLDEFIEDIKGIMKEGYSGDVILSYEELNGDITIIKLIISKGVIDIYKYIPTYLETVK